MIAAVAFLKVPFFKTPVWRATVTPLASIIGSGFLIVAPLLGFTVGNWSIVAMLGIVALAYLVGSAVRFNIASKPTENEACGKWQKPVRIVDRLSNIALSLAYIIAIAFYLELLGAFATRLVEVEIDVVQKLLASALMVLIGVYGAWHGLSGLEKLEKTAVDIKLAVIAGLLAGLALYNSELAISGNWTLPTISTSFDLETVRTLLGAFLIIQGFETSKYLSSAYDTCTRIKTMRYAQLISAAIYVTFIALATVMMDQFGAIKETGIIDMTQTIAISLPYLLMVGAVTSQFSAAVADTIASGGLIEEETGGAVTSSQVYIVATGIILFLLWTSDIFEIIAYASRAFALYYALQSAIASVSSFLTEDGARARAKGSGYALLAILMLLIAAFAIPVETTGA